MSNSNLNIKLNTRTNYEGNKNSKSQIFSDSDDEEVETFSNVVNKDGSFYKKLYNFIQSKSKYISLIIRSQNTPSNGGIIPKWDYKKSNRKPIQKKKDDDKDRENALNTINEIVKNKFSKYSEEHINLYMKEILANPPQEKCSLHDIFFQKNEKKMFIKHNLISYILNFMDFQTLMRFKECSKIDNEVVSLYLRKKLYSLSFKDNEIKTNIHYWKNVINFFFFKAGTLRPIDRTNYSLIFNELEKNKSFCIITKNSMTSNIFISLDYFAANLIKTCNHNNPLPHTCNVRNEIQGITYFKSKNITLTQFISEYYKRLQINDDELMWNLFHFRRRPEFLSLLFLEYIKCMLSILNKYNGSCIFKKTEYLVNSGHHISHRVWIQMFYEYGYEPTKEKNKVTQKATLQESRLRNSQISPSLGNNNNRTLYLTIADHYKWDA
ncbi:conserved Plasmodium protein, unknown function [Plasmodium berghei]|uniref:F-box domain-containing protein n=2 Tax=Plasmodium berghei TaxID=5821 RepID=A0A509ALF2_PLABA|nr:conserved protein, unknown function [Plasmodium berghei ANKA]CXI11007.1 conserved Plasmodium protein, unknown function [Plasmodium berghei]SCL93120.1 conserved Plasmodium protein, unknown function [Plasmodium berghei]SCM15793.1 conserved Plasmodium protein, unknown function [Plasmodium berghei]SCM17588.1 conserved Plasmodium protein, unknown function [Plasmodium berghei]SCN23069.1 conserved Plasmodium protein, unknown function [Plasmodium berghei]|eukprot:XP_034420397.1 conserved protein, unknown function [Plasmodium berghei ANKA]